MQEPSATDWWSSWHISQIFDLALLSLNAVQKVIIFLFYFLISTSSQSNLLSYFLQAITPTISSTPPTLQFRICTPSFASHCDTTTDTAIPHMYAQFRKPPRQISNYVRSIADVSLWVKNTKNAVLSPHYRSESSMCLMFIDIRTAFSVHLA